MSLLPRHLSCTVLSIQRIHVNQFWLLEITRFSPVKELNRVIHWGHTVQFCEAIHPLLCGLQSEVKLGFMDDVTLSGEMSTVEDDVCTILQASAETGLHLNTCSCSCSLAILDPRVGHTMDVLSPFIPVLCHSD